ncbi:AMP-binding protein [Pseudoalteromonas viridis]|uniref:SDR family NAD(P)-dependent oxidoreductase n=1 Tax=Pseudoalteromonas viridis TaxID=339617 RepID=A0ABX7V713_9GAMM|nr:AMP-binding protein [Pseudoalteromonas viridis]QTL36674.1 SDR family NAD(P)-dependent oxidoreductase [Pseudoalteromonas viridis]
MNNQVFSDSIFSALAACQVEFVEGEQRCSAQQLLERISIQKNNTEYAAESFKVVTAHSVLDMLCGVLATLRAGATPVAFWQEDLRAFEVQSLLAHHPVHDATEAVPLLLSLVSMDEDEVELIGHHARSLKPVMQWLEQRSLGERITLVVEHRIDLLLALVMHVCQSASAHTIILSRDNSATQQADSAIYPAASVTKPAASQHFVWGLGSEVDTASSVLLGDFYTGAVCDVQSCAAEQFTSSFCLGKHHAILDAQYRPLKNGQWGTLVHRGESAPHRIHLSPLKLSVNTHAVWSLNTRMRQQKHDSRIINHPSALLRYRGMCMTQSELNARCFDTFGTECFGLSTASNPQQVVVLSKARAQDISLPWSNCIPQVIRYLGKFKDASGQYLTKQLAEKTWPTQAYLEAQQVQLSTQYAQDVKLDFTKRAPLPIAKKYTSGSSSVVSEQSALLEGPTLDVTHETLVDALLNACEIGHGIAVIRDAQTRLHVSYQQLLDRAKVLLNNFRSQKVTENDEVIILGNNELDYFAGIWACFLGGFIAVPLLVKSEKEKQSNELAHLLGQEGMLSRPWLFVSQSDSTQLLERLPHESRLLGILSVESAEASEHFTPQPSCLLLMTSGSSGKPKGVVLSHRNLTSMAAAIAREFDYDSDEISLNWLATDHVGGLVQFHLRDVCLGCRQIHIDTEHILAEPLRWFDYIDEFRASVTWAPNFSLTLINSRVEQLKEKSWDLRCVKAIMNGGEAISFTTNQAFLKNMAMFGLGGHVIRPCFGMSETTSCIISSDNFILGDTACLHWVKEPTLSAPAEICLTGIGSEFIDVGVPTAGVSVRVVNECNELLHEGMVGRIQVTGPQIMPGYHNNDKANQETFCEDGWLDMGDLGFITDGRLVVVGREKEVIIVNGLNYACQEIEQAVEVVFGAKVGSIAAVSIRENSQDTDMLAIVMCPDDTASIDNTTLADSIQTKVAQKIGLPIGKLYFVPEELLPRTAIGKLKRKQIATQISQGAFDEYAVLGKADSHLADNEIDHWFYRQSFVARAISGLCTRASNVNVIELDLDEQHGHLIIPSLVQGKESDPVVVKLDCTALGDGFARMLVLEKVIQSLLRTTTNNLVLAVLCQENCADIGLFVGLIRTMKAETSRSIKLAEIYGDYPSDKVLNLESVGGCEDDWVMYRDGVRHVSVVEEADISIPANKECATIAGQDVIVVGGLGGVGSHISAYLLEELGCRLLVVGRSDLQTDTEKARNLKLLKQLGDVEYVSVDCSNADQVASSFHKFSQQAQFNAQYVINLAGEGDVTAQVNAFIEGVSQSKFVAAAHRRYNVFSTLLSWAQSSNATLINFSSVNGLFGGAGFRHYSAVCAYQSYLATKQDALRSFDWSMWQNLGMAQGVNGTVVDASKKLGFQTIDLERGIASFRMVLQSALPQVFIGLDPAGDMVAPQLKNAQHGYRIQCKHSGQATSDEWLKFIAQDDAQSTLTAPETESEAVLYEIWQGLLKHRDFGTQCSFFALGGDSIMTVQMVSLAARHNLAISASDVFELKSIKAIARVASAKSQEQLPAIDLSQAYEVTPIQRWYLNSGSSNLNWFNMSLIFKLPDKKPEQYYTNQLLPALTKAHPALRMGYEQQLGRWMQRLLPHEQACHFLAGEYEDSQQWREQLESQLNIETGPVLIGALNTLPSGHQELIMVAHHLNIDGVSWRILEDDLNVIFEHDDIEAVYPQIAETINYLDWTHYMSTYAERLIEQSGAAYSNGQKLFDVPVSHEAQSAILDEVTVLPDLSQRSGDLGLETLLVSSVLLALRDFTQQDHISIDLEGHGRLERGNTLDLSKTIGWFTTLTPMEVEFTQHAGIDRALSIVDAQLKRSKDTGLGKSLSRGGFESLSQVSFNYLGQFSAGDALQRPVQGGFDSMMASMSPDTVRPYIIDVAGICLADELHLGVKYDAQAFTQSQIQSLLSGIVSHLNQAMRFVLDGGNVTEIDIALNDISELDDILSELEF